MAATSWLEIDLSALDANLATFRRAMPEGAGVCAVVKADAYGLGLLPIARRLADRNIEMLAVYSDEEARTLTSAGIARPILVLMPIRQIDRTDVLYRAAVSNRLHLTVHSEKQLEAVERIGMSFGHPMPVHIELDSGMSRGGMSGEEADVVLRRLADMRYVRLAGIFTHPSSARTDLSRTNQQLHQLDQLVERNSDAVDARTLIHFANTYAAMRDAKYHRSMIRIGLGLYGYGEGRIVGSPAAGVVDLQPIVRWMSRIVHIREVPTGTTVGYDGTFTTYRPSRLAIVPLGYGDGYPTALSNRAVVRVGPNLTPADLRGKVNMDQLIIDVTEIPEAQIDTEVEVYSNNPQAPNALDKLAEEIRSHPYELLCRLKPSIVRRLVNAKSGAGRVTTSSPSRGGPGRGEAFIAR
jgi:alanine racemase